MASCRSHMYSNIGVPTNRRNALRALTGASIASMTSITAFGCGNRENNPNISVVLTLSEVLVGHHRVPFTLIDIEGSFIPGALVKASFYKLRGENDDFMFSTDVVEHAITTSKDHLHENGQVHKHTHTNGYYLAAGKSFEPGLWRADMKVQPTNGRDYIASTFFEVKDQTKVPRVGELIPPSVNPISTDVSKLAEISTADPPVPGMYTHTIATCLARAEPMVIAFSTPAFCRSRMCGPVTAIVSALYDRWQTHVRFIHIEPFDLATARHDGRLTFTSVAREWHLETEPWIFVIDNNRRVSARFEGIVSAEEFEPAIKAVAGTYLS